MAFNQPYPTTLPRKWRRQWETWVQPRVCTKCHVKYNELNNFNKDCRVHLGTYNEQFAGPKWPAFHWECCGASKTEMDAHHEFMFPRGCYYMDHTVYMSEYTMGAHRELAGTKLTLLEIIPEPFTRFMSKLLRKDTIVKFVSAPEEEDTPFTLQDEQFNYQRITPREVREEKDFDPFIDVNAVGSDSDDDDYEDDDEDERETSFYDDEADFTSYYIVRRLIPERQDMQRVNRWKSIPER